MSAAPGHLSFDQIGFAAITGPAQLKDAVALLEWQIFG